MPYLFIQNKLTLELFPPTRICGKSNISHQEWGSLPFFGLSSRILRFMSCQKLREGPLVSRLSWLPWRCSLSETRSSILSQGLWYSPDPLLLLCSPSADPQGLTTPWERTRHEEPVSLCPCSPGKPSSFQVSLPLSLCTCCPVQLHASWSLDFQI